MISQNTHISDQELLEAIDGELSRSRGATVRAHCESCWSCRARKSEFESAILGFARAYHEILDPQLPHVAGPRALLKARLVAGAVPTRSPARLWFARSAVPLVACIALLASVFGAVFLWSNFHAQPVEAGSIPDRSLTPGMTRPVSINEVCSMPHEEVIREVPNLLRRQVFEEYGLKDANAGDYEIDYLIAPGLGGTDNIHNLEPYSTEWNARVKDALEERLHELVCAHQINLETAQREVATNWIAAYQKYFHTKEPQFRWPPSG